MVPGQQPSVSTKMEIMETQSNFQMTIRAVTGFWEELALIIRQVKID